MSTVFTRDSFRAALLAGVGAFGGLAIGYVTASRGGSPMGVLLVYGTLALVIALALPPHVFLALALAFAGVSTAFSYAISVGPATLYASDMAVLLVAARGALPRPRRPAPQLLHGLPQWLFLLWAFVLVITALRAYFNGIALAAVFRGDLLLFYWPLLYFGLTRVLAEVDLQLRLLWRNLALVALGFVAYMFAARALNHPFHDPGLALVPTGANDSVARNFGFASAFIIYPILAIAGIAGMATTRDHRWRWTILACVGVVATLTTLVRGEIFSLALGILVVLWATPGRLPQSGRTRTIVQLALAAGAAMLFLLAIQPRLGHAIVQRSLPLTHQAQEATANANYRFDAVSTGIHVARAHPWGLGILDQQSLQQQGIDPGFIAHSGFATLLIFGGWAALAASALVLLALVRRSFRAPRVAEWTHVAFVGAIVTLAAYSFGAAGLAGDPWVIPLGALAVALRFGIPREHA